MPVPSTIASLLRRLDLTTSPPERFSLLQTIIGQFLPLDPEQTLDYLNRALPLAEMLKSSEGQAWCHKHIGLTCEVLCDHAGAYRAFGRAVHFFRKLDTTEEGESLLKMGNAAVADGRYSQGAEAFAEAVQLYTAHNDPHGLLAGLKSMGDLYDQIGDHRKGLEYRFQALRLTEELNDPRLLGVASCDLAATYARLGEYDRALDSFRQTLDLFRLANARKLEVKALSNLTTVHIERGDTEAALECGLRAVAIYEVLGDRNGLGTMFLNLADIYEGTEGLETALDMRLKAHTLFEESDNLEAQGSALLSLGQTYRKMGHHHHAIHLLEHALRIARERKDVQLEYHSSSLLSYSFEEVGNLRQALRHIRRWSALREQIEGAEQRRSVVELQARFDLEQAEKEREIWRLKSRQLEDEMGHKTAELASATLSLVEKNRFLNDVEKAIAELEKKADGELKPLIGEIISAIKKHTDTEQDWETFEQRFEQVHGDFIRTLSGRYPSLTPVQLRVCALIRTGLSSIEIADLLHVTKKAIDTYRFRIREKMGLNTQENLASFLTAI